MKRTPYEQRNRPSPVDAADILNPSQLKIFSQKLNQNLKAFNVSATLEQSWGSIRIDIHNPEGPMVFNYANTKLHEAIAHIVITSLPVAGLRVSVIRTPAKTLSISVKKDQ